jgi:hypothetical protein
VNQKDVTTLDATDKIMTAKHDAATDHDGWFAPAAAPMELLIREIGDMRLLRMLLNGQSRGAPALLRNVLAIGSRCSRR